MYEWMKYLNRTEYRNEVYWSVLSSEYIEPFGYKGVNHLEYVSDQA